LLSADAAAERLRQISTPYQHHVGIISYETHLSTQRSQAQAHAWFPRSHGHQEWSCRPGTPSRQGPQASKRLIENTCPVRAFLGGCDC
jgi:hypothetical protein